MIGFRLPSPHSIACFVLTVLTALSGSACRRDMQDQPRYEPYGRSSFFADHRQARPLPEGSVARGHLNADTYFYSGKTQDGEPASAFPMPVTMEVLRRGRERYGIYCTPCHGETGVGNGMVVQRGFPQAASFHEQRLRDSEPGYFFDVITNGFGVMPSYAAQVPVADRWAIIAYINALQLSQNASIREVPKDQRAALSAADADPRGVSGHDGGNP